MYYAQIDENGICFAVTQTYGPIQQADMIPVDSFDQSLLGQKRVGESWEVVPIDPVVPVEPSQIAQLEQVIDTLLTGGETV